MAVVLGLSFFYHDSAAALAVHGEVVAAVAEERLCRRKHTSEFPKLAVEYCLDQAGLRSINDLDAIVFYEKPLTKLLRVIETSVTTWPLSAARFVTRLPFYLKSKVDIRKVIRRHYPSYEGYVLFNEHHLSHAAAAFFPSPFSEAAIMTLDGVGEWETTAVGYGEDRKIRLDLSLHFPHSIGLLYSALTAYLGFQVNDGEWKVMGLAPYGEPRYVKEFRQLVRLGGDGSFALDMRYFAHHWSNRRAFHQRRWQDLFGFPPRRPDEEIEQRHEDLARSGQAVAEELILGIARHARDKYGCANLVIAGGVGLNSVANWAIEREGIFDRIWIQPAAGDDGGALGAALYVAHQLEGDPRQPQGSAALGPEYDDRVIEEFLASRDIPFERLDRPDLVRRAADAIAAGQVVGWFQGKMEFGPRALGHRSILADATNPEMKSVINGKIKFREYFRPFAPSVPLDRVHEFFDVAPGTELPFMLKIPNVRAEMAGRLPAITHEDGTGRVQTVDVDHDALFHSLLVAVGERTGVPIVVNTSFNVRGEPVVCTPYDAWRCFSETGIDTLFLGSFCVTQKAGSPLDVEARYAHSDLLEAQIDRSDEEAEDVVAEVHDVIDRTVIGTHDPAQVLEFYRSLPFNFFSNATDASLALMRRNQIEHYPDLDRVLRADSAGDVLDVGCGAGWFSNSCLHYYEHRVTGFDFNSVAVRQARGVARLMKRAKQIDLFVGNVFEVELEARFDVVNSIGVLHHTEDCHKAIRRAARWVRPGGCLHLGLYHDQGRRPFLERFRSMQDRGASVEEMFEAFELLEFPAEDRVHLYSWFRDQVLHPHETQHGFAEIAAVLEEEGFTVASSSLCGFKPVPSRAAMNQLERGFGELGEKRLAQKRYFPGFFTLLARAPDGDR
jgi:carbamoyltransferase